MDDDHQPIDAGQLLKNLTRLFNLDELRTLSFQVGVDWDELEGSTKTAKARELIAYLQRHGRLDELVAAAAQARPHANWPTVPAAALLLTIPLDHVPAVAPLPPGSRMPLLRNPLFVGRQSDLIAIARTLQGAETTAIGQIAAATGLGGIGKTQLAGEFAHRYGQYFAGGVFWLSFADPAAVPAEVAACGAADALALQPGFSNLPLEEQVRLVSSAWQSPRPRLLIFDNCEDETLLAQRRLPPARHQPPRRLEPHPGRPQPAPGRPVAG